MILFTHARFKNFRILRDTQLEFSTNRDKPLTVIRGENASGKTTILWALQWAFWGDVILPDGGRSYRLHPLDWDLSDGPCEISVQITFETEVDAEGTTGIPRRYSLNRQCVEEVNAEGSFSRHSHTLSLYELTDQGTLLKSHPDDFLSAILPRELREVFFTDGARVLSFTGAELSNTTKRKRVQDAIRALLGIDLLEHARGHVKWVMSEINSQLRESSGDDFLKEISGKIARAQSELDEQTRIRDSAADQWGQFEGMYAETSSQLSAALTKGNREELAADLDAADADAKRYRQQIDDCLRMRSDLFKDANLPAGLLYRQMLVAREQLSQLEQANQIPRSYFPVLQQRLELKKCICGEDLAPEDAHWQHIMALMEDQKEADEASVRLTQLVASATKFIAPDRTGHEWLMRLKDLWKMQSSAEAGWRDAESKKRSLNLRINDLPNTDVKQLQAHKDDLLRQRDRALETRASADTSIARLNQEVSTLLVDQKNWMRRQSRYLEQHAQLEATQDLVTVIEQTLLNIQHTKVGEVSEKMNDYFLQMIGAGQDGDIVQRAAIGPDFGIVVYGLGDKNLDPDQDLSGAQRRSLTIAFILAVTTVSGVTAPSVIDTPISELSGAVRTECLRIMSELSQQLILFLTRSDIEGVEAVIDKHAGTVTTISNSTHYPQFLVNQPSEDKATAMICKCTHRQYCRLCERNGDAFGSLLKPRTETTGATV